MYMYFRFRGWYTEIYVKTQYSYNLGPKRPGRDDDGKNDGDESARDVFELPPELANPQKAPCVNVPEW